MVRAAVCIVGALLGGGIAWAGPILQFDLNGVSAQALNASGQASAFGGLSHTGRVKFSAGLGSLAGMFSQAAMGSASANLNFNTGAFSVSSFNGEIVLNQGKVTGGSLTLTISNGDSYTCQLVGASGQVSKFVGGGYKIEGLTKSGFFSDAQFGNVAVQQWFNAQGAAGLWGSFLQFQFNPNVLGASTADLDWFVDVVPLPTAAWAGMVGLGLVAARRRLRKGHAAVA